MKLTLAQNHNLPTGALGLAITPDGQSAYAACADGFLYEVDVATGKAEQFLGQHTSYATGCVLLPGGKTVITGGYDGMLLWHDVATRRSWRRAKAHEFWNWQMALSPDGQRLATTTGQYAPGNWNMNPRRSEKLRSRCSTRSRAIWWRPLATRHR